VTVFYIDISSYQAGINLAGWHAVCSKISQGTGYTNPYWTRFKGSAANVGAYFFGYHFLTAGNGAGQADYYWSRAGRLPAMIDFEPSNTRPGMGDAISFCDRLRARGGIVNMVYLPHWYWQQIGSPSLTPFINRHLHLVSSAYSAYSDGGGGWAPYGGMRPDVWQYTSTMRTGGFGQVDCNAYKGSFAQLAAMVGGQPAAPGPKPPHPAPAGMLTVPDCAGKTAGNAHNRLVAAHMIPAAATGQKASQICSGLAPVIGSDVKPGTTVTIIAGDGPLLRQGDASGWVRLAQHDLNKTSAGIATDGGFGPATSAAVHTFQASHKLTADSVIGPATWAALGAL
jgi:GH25 family lysozyme M1 (1,4-beta-N-acetylmuramidase)